MTLPPETAQRIGHDIDRAVDILRSGGVVGVPTETVYGLGADASNSQAVARIFRIKGRPSNHPLIVHVANAQVARRWAGLWPNEAEALAESFWPGPLTLIVSKAAHVIDEVTGGLPTVALRCPSHPMMQELLQEFGGGIAAPSANRFGKVSPTTAGHVLDDLGDDVDYVLDGGPCAIGVESTIVDCTKLPVQILRPGGIPASDIRRVLGAVDTAHGPSRAPGMLESHYAPACRIHCVESTSRAEEKIMELRHRFESVHTATPSRAPVILDASSDPESFAASMYSVLRECDRSGIDDVVVILPDDEGIGAAIRDRILKASHRS